MKLKNFLNGIKAENIIVRLISSLCIANGILIIFENTTATDIDFLDSVSILSVAVLTVSFFALISIVSAIMKKAKGFTTDIQSLILLISVLFYCLISVFFDNEEYFCIGMSVAAVVAVMYFVFKNPALFSGKDLSKKAFNISVTAVFTISFAVVSSIGIFRYLTFSTPNFDFGIFSESLNNIKKTLIPYNTSERDFLMSHFQVHISPVIYLALPLSCIMPVPVALQLIQAIAVTLSVIPVCLICKNHSLGNKTTLVFAVLCLFYPALTTGTFYDFHENAFLTVFILWFLYFMEKEKNIPMFVFMVLTFSVKEDAMIYMLFIGLYMLFLTKKNRIKGLVVIVCSVAYFIFCLWILNKYGMGAMTDRFDEYITDRKLGLLSVVLNIIKSPAYVIKNCFTTEKLIFIIECFAPLCFLPMLTKKFSRYILLFPFILMNLMPTYIYQHSIEFQYVYGVMALFFYMSILNVSEFQPSLKRKILPVALVVTAVFYSGLVLPKLYYIGDYVSKKESIKQANEVLSVIPEDAEVSSSTFFVAALSDRKTVYQLDYTEHKTEYVVIDLRYNSVAEYKKEYGLDGYECIKTDGKIAAVFKKEK